MYNAVEYNNFTFTTEKQNLQILLDQPDKNTKNVLANLRYLFIIFYYAFIFCTLSTLNLGIWRILTELSHFKGNAPLPTHHPRPSRASSFLFSNFLHNKSVTSGQRLNSLCTPMGHRRHETCASNLSLCSFYLRDDKRRK